MKGFSIAALATCLLTTGCFESGTTTVTMFWATTDLGACLSAQSQANGPVDIGGLSYAHHPHESLLCVSDKSGDLIAAYSPESNKTATHRWIQKGGAGVWGTKHTFEPIPRGEDDQGSASRVRS